MGLVLSLLATASLIGGCATPKTRPVPIDPMAQAREEALQKRLVIETQGRDQMRLMSIAWPILTAATPLCGEKTSPAVGFVAATVDDFNEEFKDAAREFYGLTERPTVIGVVTGSPAEQAGLKRGDALISINDAAVETGSKATSKLLKQLRAQLASGDTLRFTVEREGQRTELKLTPELSCDYAVFVNPSGEVNAAADGKSIVVTKGMLRFVESDIELSTVIAHELAHNAMGHIEAQTTNYVLGSIFDILAAIYGINTQGAFGGAAATVYSKEFEAEADYVAMYALALADLPLAEAPTLWRRMAAEAGTTIKSGYGASHPGSADRFVAMEATVAEIESKRARGEELRPNLKAKND
jgi:hypothetical protein